MKHKLVTYIMVLSAFVLLAMNSSSDHSVEGTWLVAEKTAKITIAPCGKKLCGTISWLKDPSKAEGKSKIGMVILKDFIITDHHTLESGKIYDPRTDKWYSGSVKMESDGRLEVRGWVGLQAFGKSVYWTRM